MGEGRAIIIPALRMKKNKNFLHVLLLCSARLEEQRDSLILSHQRHLSPTVYLTLLTHQIHTISAYRSIKFDDPRVRTVSALEESHSIALAISPWHVSKPPFAPSWPLPLILGPVVLFVDLWFLAPLLQVKIKHRSNGAMMEHTLWRVLDCILRCSDHTVLSVRLPIESTQLVFYVQRE